MSHKITTSLKTLIAHLINTACSSYNLFKSSNLKLTAITVIDFVMQIYPNILYPYLTYTAIRCSILTIRYHQPSAIANQHQIWQEAQLYSSTKVVGLIVSQAMLAFLGLTTPLSVIIVFSWGLILASLSAFMHHKASSLLLKTSS